MNVVLPTIPQAAVIMLPLLVTLCTGLTGHQQLPAWANSVIAAIFIALGAVLSIALGAGFSGNVAADFMLFAGYSAALIASPIFKPLLDKLLASTPSPLARLSRPKTAAVATQGKTSRAAATVPRRPAPRPVELTKPTAPPQPPPDTAGG